MLAFLARLILRLLFRVEVRGQIARQPGEKTLIVANHESFLDGVILGAFLPLAPTYIVHTTIARLWYFKLLLNGFGVSHVVVDAANPMAMKGVLQAIESGTPIVIFPEGRITVTGGLMKIYDGPAFLAAKTGATVIPVQLDGPVYTPFGRMSRPFPRKLLPKIRLTIFPPTHIPMPEARTAKLRRRLASEEVRRLMQLNRFKTQAPQTLIHAFLDAIDILGRKRGFLEDMRQTEENYGSILKATLALSRLVSKVTSENEVVGVLMPNLSTTLSLLLGMTAMRRVPAMINYTSGTDGMQSACELAKIQTILTSKSFVEKARLGDALARLRGVKLLYLEDLRPQFTTGDKLWLILYALRFPRRIPLPASPEDSAVVLFTSGSEGKPKGVVLSHRAILANIAQIRAIIDFSPADKVMNALPMFHSFGLTAGTLLPALAGARLFLYPSPLHYRVIPEIIYDRDCTVTFGTGTFLANYAKAAHPYDFYKLRYVVAGAEKLSDEVRQTYYNKFGLRILEGYGATECAPVIAVNTPMAFQAGTVGTVLPGMETRLNPVPGIEKGGELHVTGPNLMSGYLLHDQPGVLQPPKSIFGEGWYATGDIVQIDGEGFISIQARLKRFAKVAGEMVSLEVVEKIAATASEKHQHAAVAQQDANRGEVIVLYTEDPALQRPQLQAAAQKLGAPEIAIPRQIRYLEKLPLLGSGKRDYVKLKEMVAQPEPAKVS